jgi:hypothetical protein
MGMDCRVWWNDARLINYDLVIQSAPTFIEFSTNLVDRSVAD